MMVSYKHEIRFTQYPEILGFVIYFLSFGLSVYIKSHLVIKVSVAIYSFMVLISFGYLVLYGEDDFDRLPEVSGDYGIGIKRAYAEQGNFLLVYYPVERK